MLQWTCGIVFSLQTLFVSCQEKVYVTSSAKGEGVGVSVESECSELIIRIFTPHKPSSKTQTCCLDCVFDTFDVLSWKKMPLFRRRRGSRDSLSSEVRCLSPYLAPAASFLEDLHECLMNLSGVVFATQQQNGRESLWFRTSSPSGHQP